jgi:hypothetical protein
VILRQAMPGAPLVVAGRDPGATPGRHGPDRFFGMAIGVDGDRPGWAVIAFVTSR